MRRAQTCVEAGEIRHRILAIRGVNVILDADLAAVYGVSTRRLNEQVKRNQNRFPSDFMFRLTAEEKTEVVAKCDHLHKLKFSRSLPLVFTEHGAIMAASILSSPRAIEVSLFVVRAFAQMREIVAGRSEIAAKLEELECRLAEHDDQILALIRAIRQLMGQRPMGKVRRIGFHAD